MTYIRNDGSEDGGLKGAHTARRCHFCVLVNQWCRGSAPSGRPDDCIGCGRCELKNDGEG